MAALRPQVVVVLVALVTDRTAYLHEEISHHRFIGVGAVGHHRMGPAVRGQHAGQDAPSVAGFVASGSMAWLPDLGARRIVDASHRVDHGCHRI